MCNKSALAFYLFLNASNSKRNFGSYKLHISILNTFQSRLSIIPFEKILIGVWMTFGTCGQQLIRTEFSPRVSFLMDKMSNSSLLIVQFLMNGSQGGQKSRLLKILLLLGSNKGHFKMISSEDP